ncbi:MAG: phosphoribosylformylglycinamidine synthase subunit PurS [Candidatus Cloacimonetes bacterium]|jgi:phosphoribosylformylglycinamidine synthase|nr:phosphoribosylformylglycinamidine synthase subunit PurS [Candidatus Cloacimonadota bacterium]MDD4155790.1 phosphoribosylformylglycinamidine synthase subunit PurS [Candidatus Cloacimonadota bacterium]
MIKAKVYVTLKPSVLDPQGKVITNALHTLGYDSIEETRASKFFEISFNESDIDIVQTKLHEICDKVLANPNTEVYSFNLEKINE